MQIKFKGSSIKHACTEGGGRGVSAYAYGGRESQSAANVRIFKYSSKVFTFNKLYILVKCNLGLIQVWYLHKMKGVTNSVLYLLYIQNNCVRAHRGVQANVYILRTGGGGCQKLAISCVHTVWMAPKPCSICIGMIKIDKRWFSSNQRT